MKIILYNDFFRNRQQYIGWNIRFLCMSCYRAENNSRIYNIIEIPHQTDSLYQQEGTYKLIDAMPKKFSIQQKMEFDLDQKYRFPGIPYCLTYMDNANNKIENRWFLLCDRIEILYKEIPIF